MVCSQGESRTHHTVDMGLLSFLFGDHTRGKSGDSVSKSSTANRSLENLKAEMKALKTDIEMAKQNPSQLFEREEITASKPDDIREAVAHLRDDATEQEKARVEEFLRTKQILEESLTIARDTKNEGTRDSRLELAKAKLDRLIAYSDSEDCPLEIGTEVVESIQKMIEELSAHKSSIITEAHPHRKPKFPSNRSLLGKTTGEIFAELTGGANLVDGKQTWEYAENSKHDLDTMLRCCYAELKSQDCGRDWGAAPYYFERAAILLRKEKRYEDEVNICEIYLSAIQDNTYFFEHSPTVQKIKHRLNKAKILAAKERQLN